MRLKGRHAIITGGASGIGAAAARRFVEEGARVFLCGLDRDEIDQAAREIDPSGMDVRGMVADITDAAACIRLVNDAEAFFGVRHDIFLANAGAPFSGGFLDAEQSLIDATIAVNLAGAIHSARASLASMEQAGFGSFVFTSSVQSVIARPLRSVYTATKHAITGLVKGLALEFGPKGIRVNAVAPSAVDTPLLRRQIGGAGEDIDAGLARLARSMPLGRLPGARDIANGALFLVSDEAAAITGHTLLVDSGAAAGSPVPTSIR